MSFKKPKLRYTRGIFLPNDGLKPQYNFRDISGYLLNSGYVLIPNSSNDTIFYSINRPLIIWSQNCYKNKDFLYDQEYLTWETSVRVIADRSKRNLVEKVTQDVRAFILLHKRSRSKK